MTQENGGINSADLNKAADDANGQKQDLKNQEGGGDINADINKRIDDLTALVESLKKESSGKDKKIAQMLSEKELQELSTKTKDEQLEIYKNKTAMYERKEAYRQSLKEVGLSADEFISIADEKDPALQASKFAELLKQKTEKAVNEALEKYKTEELKKIGQPPKPKNSTPQPNASQDKNDFLRRGLALAEQ